MLPELGFFTLLGALMVCVFSVYGGLTSQSQLLLRASRLTAVMMMAVFALLLYSFFETDLTLQIVYQHADQTLPWYYRLGALWGGHEGSMILWLVLLNAWIFAASYFKLDEKTKTIFLTTLALVNIGLLCFSIFTSNPFARYLPITPTFGRDLNPLLQDMVMLIHPPILYMGYVGTAIPFALAIAALITGKLHRAILSTMRKSVLVAWAFLTFGITLGSFWAYYELGWGGWWFWDPVENASLLPWLAGTALLHMVLVTGARKSFQSWTLLLAIITFSLALLGTFLVRSGALTSVHSFANDPERGLFILALLGVYTLGAMVLFSLRANRFESTKAFAVTSREGLLLMNNILFMVVLGTVLLGTLYPLVIEMLGLGFISVGAPYFNVMVVPLALLMCVLLGFSPYSQWKQAFSWNNQTIKTLSIGFVLLLALGLASLALLKLTTWWVAVSLLLVAWIASQTIIDLIAQRFKLSLHRWGMHVAHIGFAALVVGVSITSTYDVENDVVLKLGDTFQLNEYDFTLNDVRPLHGPNYTSAQAVVSVYENDKLLTQMKPEKRFYTRREMPMAEVAIYGNLLRDLYIALAEPLNDDKWILRIHYKPFVRWIWLGGLLMAVGAMLSWFDKKYLSNKREVVS